MELTHGRRATQSKKQRKWFLPAPSTRKGVPYGRCDLARRVAGLAAGLLSQVIGQLETAVCAKNCPRLVTASDLANDHEGSSLIDSLGIMMGVLFGNVHGHEGTKESAAGSAESGAANPADYGADPGQKRTGHSSRHGPCSGPGHGARRSAFCSIFLELQTWRAANDAETAVGHVDAIWSKASPPQGRHRLLRLRLLLKDANYQVFSWFHHKATSRVDERIGVEPGTQVRQDASSITSLAKRMPAASEPHRRGNAPVRPDPGYGAADDAAGDSECSPDYRETPGDRYPHERRDTIAPCRCPRRSRSLHRRSRR